MPRRTVNDVHDQIVDLRHDFMRSLAAIRIEVLHSRSAEAADTREINERLEALETRMTALQDSIDVLNANVEELATDLGDIPVVFQEFRDRIAALAAENNTLEEQNAALVKLAADMDVANAQKVQPIADRVKALDAGLKDPATPLAPTP